MPTYPIGSKVKVLHEYIPPQDHCLKLNVGEIITVVRSKNMDNEWVAGKNATGKIGFFPALYVELVAESTPVATEQIAMSVNHSVESAAEIKQESSTTPSPAIMPSILVWDHQNKIAR